MFMFWQISVRLTLFPRGYPLGRVTSLAFPLFLADRLDVESLARWRETSLVQRRPQPAIAKFAQHVWSRCAQLREKGFGLFCFSECRIRAGQIVDCATRVRRHLMRQAEIRNGFPGMSPLKKKLPSQGSGRN